MVINRRSVITGAAVGAAGVGLAAAAPASAAGAASGELDFAVDFHASFAEVAAWMESVPSNAPRPEVKWAAGSYAMTAQLGLRSGHRLRGTDLPSREYGTGVRWRAPAGAGSFFTKRANSQGYPSDGSVRDLTVSGIEFYGNTPVLPLNAVDSGSYSGNTQWYTEFRDCGFIGARLMSGWGDGFHVTGTTHVQAITDTWVTCGGAENSLFTGGGISFLDSSVMSAGKPFIRMFSDMWTMGSAMISARGNCYQLLVSGGGNGRVIGTYFDAPASQRTQLPQVNVSGGRSLSITNASFHNGTVGIQCAGGPTVVLVQGNVFNDETGAPLVCQPAFTGIVKWGHNAYTGSTPRTLRVNSLSQVIVDDPQVTVTDLNGKVLQPANR